MDNEKNGHEHRVIPPAPHLPKWVQKIKTAHEHCKKSDIACILIGYDAKKGKIEAFMRGDTDTLKTLIMQLTKHVVQMEARQKVTAPIVDASGRPIASTQGETENEEKT